MRRAKLGLVLLVLGSAIAGVAVGASCADATQVKLVLVGASSLTCTPTPLTAIYSRAPSEPPGAPPQGTTRACVTNGRIGDVVFTPSERGGDVLVQVETNLDGADGCAAGNPRCIVARRRFAFVEHRSLELSITIDPQCAGVVCRDDQTCYQGACTGATVECAGSTCALPDERPDAGPVRDAGVDAPVTVDAADAGGTFCGSGDYVVPDLDGVAALVQGPSSVYYVTAPNAVEKAGRVGRLSFTRSRAERTYAEAPDLEIAPADDAYAYRSLVSKDPPLFLALDPGATPIPVPGTNPDLFGVGPSAKTIADVVLAEPKSLLGGVDVLRGGTPRCSVIGAPNRLLVTDAEELLFVGTVLHRCDAASDVNMGNVNPNSGATLTHAEVRTVALGDAGPSETYVGWATATPNGVGYVRRSNGNNVKPKAPPSGAIVGLGLFRRGVVWAERVGSAGGTIQLKGMQFGIGTVAEPLDEGSIPSAAGPVVFLTPALGHPNACALWLEKGKIHTLALDRPGSVASDP